MAHNTTHNPIETTVESADFKVIVSIDYGRLKIIVNERDKQNGISIISIDNVSTQLMRIATDRYVKVLWGGTL